MTTPAEAFDVPERGVLEWRVKMGDSLERLSSVCRVDIEGLVNLNMLSGPEGIRPGDRLELPVTFHLAVAGESLESVAARLQVDPALLSKLNAAPHPLHVTAGDVLFVPSVKSAAADSMLKALKALAEDSARAMGELYAGSGGPREAFQVEQAGHILRVVGLPDTDELFTFADDFAALRRSSSPGSEPARTVSLKDPVEDFRRLLLTDALQDVLWSVAAADSAEVEAPTYGPGGDAVRLAVTSPLGVERSLTYDFKSGELSLQGPHAGAAGTRKLSAGSLPYPVTRALLSVLRPAPSA